MPEFIVESVGPVEIWTIDGETRRNCLRRALVEELSSKVAALDDRRNVSAVVITGAGDKAFCAGADLKERLSMDDAQVRSFLQTLNGALRRMEKSRAIFIAALNGVALGGGTELALACDFRVASANAELGLTEVKLGIIPGAGGTQRLSRLVGLSRAKELVLTGRRLASPEALTWGLVNQIVAVDSVVKAAVALGGTISSSAPLAVAAAKRALEEGMGLPLDEALAVESREYQTLLGTADRQEGLKAFSEKRPAKFEGR